MSTPVPVVFSHKKKKVQQQQKYNNSSPLSTSCSSNSNNSNYPTTTIYNSNDSLTHRHSVFAAIDLLFLALMLSSAVTRRTGRNGPVPFANDPFRGPPLSVNDDLIRPLSLDHRPTGRDDDHYLSTALIDYLIQRGMPTDLASHF